MSKIRKSTCCLLIVALVLVLCGSFLACMFNTGMFSVNVSRISFDTANGTLSGLLYMPKDASASNPRPTVILTHGYLNSAEMQDANAIELSRRGYVVFAFDMYDHGHSDIRNEVYEPYAPYGAFLMTWAPFWVNSMNDAVQYIYEQPYVLKDENGNGVIGVTGHSMGGFSSTMAVFNDEQAFAATGVRKIMANLTEGSDFNYSGIFGVTADVFNQSGGGRTLGKVAAQYDEFFFNAPDDPAGATVRKKNYVGTPDGKTFLQQENGQANTWYETSDGGKRIIYQLEPLLQDDHRERDRVLYHRFRRLQQRHQGYSCFQPDLAVEGSLRMRRPGWLYPVPAGHRQAADRPALLLSGEHRRAGASERRFRLPSDRRHRDHGDRDPAARHPV